MPKVAVYANCFETSSLMTQTKVEVWHTISRDPFKHVFTGKWQWVGKNGQCEFDLPVGSEVTFRFSRNGFQDSRTPLIKVPAEGIKFENYFDNIPSQIPTNLTVKLFTWAMNVKAPKWGCGQFAATTIREPNMTQAHYPQGVVGCKGKLVFTNRAQQEKWLKILEQDAGNYKYNQTLEKAAFNGACAATLAALYFNKKSRNLILSGSAYFLYRALDWLFLSKHKRTKEAIFYITCVHTLTALFFTKDIKQTLLPSGFYLLYRTLAWLFFAKTVREFYTGIVPWGPFANKTTPFNEQGPEERTTADGGYMAVTSGMDHPGDGDEVILPIEGPNGLKVRCKNINPAGEHMRGVMYTHEMWNSPPSFCPTADEAVSDENTRNEHGHRTMYAAPKHRIFSTAVGLAAGIVGGATFFTLAKQDRFLRRFAETVGVVAGCASFAGVWEILTRLDPDNKPEDEAKLSASPGLGS